MTHHPAQEHGLHEALTPLDAQVVAVLLENHRTFRVFVAQRVGSDTIADALLQLGGPGVTPYGSRIHPHRRTTAMAEHTHVPTLTEVHFTDTTFPAGSTPAQEDRRAPMVCHMGQRGLTGLFLMMASCAAPLLLVLAVPLLGTVLGGRGVPAVRALAVLACPVGMAWMMHRQRDNGQAPGPGQAIS